MVRVTKKLLHGRTDVQARVYVHFLRWVWRTLNSCSEHQCICRYVHYTNVFLTSVYISDKKPSTGRARALVYALFLISVGGWGWGVSASLCRYDDDGFYYHSWGNNVVIAFGTLSSLGTCCWYGTLLFTWGKLEGLSVFSVFFDGDGSAYGCMCVYTHTHTHMHVGYLDVSPGIGTRHLESLKNPDGLNLGTYVFVCVYKIYMCIYMLEDRIFNILFLPEKQIFESKKCECETEKSNLRYIDS